MAGQGVVMEQDPPFREQGPSTGFQAFASSWLQHPSQALTKLCGLLVPDSMIIDPIPETQSTNGGTVTVRDNIWTLRTGRKEEDGCLL